MYLSHGTAILSDRLSCSVLSFCEMVLSHVNQLFVEQEAACLQLVREHRLVTLLRSQVFPKKVLGEGCNGVVVMAKAA